MQNAVATASDEIKQLKNSSTTLREELENMRFAKDEAVQSAVLAANDEIIHLNKTACPFRERLEDLPF